MKIASIVFIVFASLVPACRPQDPTRITQLPEGGSCASNLANVGHSLQAYVFARGGTFPAALSEPFTVDTSNKLWRHLICPQTRPTIANDGVYSTYSYTTLSGERTWENDGKDFVVFDSKPVHGNARYVLLSDLSTVSCISEPEFQQMLSEQKERWAAKGQTIEVIDKTFIPLSARELAQYRASLRSPFFSVWFLAMLAILAAFIVLLVVLFKVTKSPPPPAPQPPTNWSV